MKIDKNKVIGLTYELEVDGKIADKATEEHPLDYIHGTNMLIPKFESELEGKQPGDVFEFTLSPAEGYGEYFMERKFDLPMESFMVDGKVVNDMLFVGNTLRMLNSSNQVVQGTITEIKENAVTMDFNHPMAGKTLHFSGKVLTVRDATEKELTEGLHGEYLPVEDGCGCGCGEDDCHCGEEHHEDGECCHGKHHEDGECCHGKHHEDGECCHGKHHEDGECCHEEHHEDGECCHGKHHEDGECCHGKHHEDGECHSKK
ncbi:MAG: peptidylprolyl isomerase [Bacteroidales bacterium]